MLFVHCLDDLVHVSAFRREMEVEHFSAIFSLVPGLNFSSGTALGITRNNGFYEGEVASAKRRLVLFIFVVVIAAKNGFEFLPS